MDAERIAEIRARVDAATDGPWAFGTAPAEGSDESKAEYLSRALTGAGPLYALWVPASVGHPDGYLVPAVTGDGPNAGNNAEFIAHARTDVPDLLAEVERLTAERDALAAALAEQTARADHEDRCAVTAQRTADCLAAQVERVRGLHERRWVLIGGVGGFVCATCEVPVESEPCPTVRALDEEAG